MINTCKKLPDKHLPYKQRGVAIITALLIVAIAATISATMATRLQLDIRRTGNILISEQSVLYTLAAEDWSRRILRDDRKENNYDHLKEDWAFEIPPLPYEGGFVKGKLTDLQACINLNSLLADGVVDNVMLQRFNRLLTTLQLDQSLSQAIIDWIDKDQGVTIPNGAEDSYYTSLDKPYRTANTRMRSVSELRLIKGFENNETYQALKNFVCAVDGQTSINVNTAPEEVLSSIANNINTKDIIDKRSDVEGFKDIGDFIASNNLKKIVTVTDGLSTSSDYFLLESEYVIGQSRTIMYSIIHRDDKGETRVTARSQGAY